MGEENILKWPDHIERMKSGEFVNKKVYVSEIEGPSRREKPIGRWKDSLKEYMHERGVSRGSH